MTRPVASNPSAFLPSDRRALVSVATQFFVNGAVFASFVPRLPEIRDRLNITVGVLGLLLTLAGGIGLIGSASAGRLVERFGSRRVLIGGGIALICSLPIVGFASTPIALLAGLAGLQTFDVIADVAMNLQGSWLSARRHAPVMNRLHGLWSLGTVIGGVASSQLARLGVSVQIHLLGVTVLLLGAVVFVGRGLLRQDEHVDESTHHQAAGSPSPGRQSRGPLVMLAVAGACAITVELTSGDWAAFRLSDDFATTAGFAGLGYVAFTIGMTGGRLLGDWAQLRLGIDRLFRAAIGLATVGMAGATLVPNRWVTLAAYATAGVGIATFFPRLYDDAAQLRGRRGGGLGALTGGSRTAGLIAPLVVGTLAASRLSVGSAVAIVTLPTALAFYAVTRWSSPRARRVPLRPPGAHG